MGQGLEKSLLHSRLVVSHGTDLQFCWRVWRGLCQGLLQISGTHASNLALDIHPCLVPHDFIPVAPSQQAARPAAGTGLQSKQRF